MQRNLVKNNPNESTGSIQRSALPHSQKLMRPKIRALLELLERPNDIIELFKRGYCAGLATIALYALYLEALKQDDPNLIAPDDWVWFEDKTQKIIQWDGKYDSIKNDLYEVLRFIDLMEYFQHASLHTCFSQGNLHQLLEDTKKRVPKLEYTLAGLFTAEDFQKEIAIPDKTNLIVMLLQHERRLIIISRGGHSLGLFRNGNNISFYNANSGRQNFTTTELSKVILAIFSAYDYKTTAASPLGFRIYTFSKKSGKYPAPKLVLAQLNSPAKTVDYSAIHLAARIGSKKCVKYYLRQGISVDEAQLNNCTPLYLAAAKGYVSIVKLLISKGANINLIKDSDKSPLIIAASKGRIAMLKIMLEGGHNFTSDNLITALKHLNHDSERADLLKSLDQNKLSALKLWRKKSWKTFPTGKLEHARFSIFFKITPSNTQNPDVNPIFCP